MQRLGTNQSVRIGSLSAGKLAVVLVSLLSIGVWVFYRVSPISPAILGDEYLYSLNARHSNLWGEGAGGDFSNYLFNFVYSLSNVCGPDFYSCVKGLNVAFFLGTLWFVFVIANRYLPFWISISFIWFAGLSPLGVYTSMFIPESMYFFGLSVTTLLTIRAIRADGANWRDALYVGLAIGLTSLVKPHAWLFVLPFIITLTVKNLSYADSHLRRSLRDVAAFLFGAVVARLVVGVAVGGPKALGFFGIYVDSTTVNQLLGSTGSDGEGEGTGLQTVTPLSSALEMFPGQFAVHLTSLYALAALGFSGLLLNVWWVIRTKSIAGAKGFPLFVLIWSLSMVVTIALFTGWITGGGDDHSLRVLHRYYDLLFVMIPLAGLTVFSNFNEEDSPAWLRWVIVLSGFSLISTAFTGLFSTLTIQIADAPNLAGLVVDLTTFNGAAIVTAIGLLIFATFPRFVRIFLPFSLVFTMLLTGWNIQEQYRAFRVPQSTADVAGKFIASNTSLSRGSFFVVGGSRFEATNAAFWIDNASTLYEIIVPETQLPKELIPNEADYVLLMSGVSLSDDANFQTIIEGEGFVIAQRSN